MMTIIETIMLTKAKEKIRLFPVFYLFYLHLAKNVKLQSSFPFNRSINKTKSLGRQDAGRDSFSKVAVEYRFLLQCMADNFSWTLNAGRQIKVDRPIEGCLTEVRQ